MKKDSVESLICCGLFAFRLEEGNAQLKGRKYREKRRKGGFRERPMNPLMQRLRVANEGAKKGAKMEVEPCEWDLIVV